MDFTKFETTVPGKWVLAGEHSVLRGTTAVAIPHTGVSLKLTFAPDRNGRQGYNSKLEILPESIGPILRDLIGSITETWEQQGLEIQMPSGKLVIESTIPIGAGLGSSAALCVAVTRWLLEPLRIPQSQCLDFATQLEHRFHGRSSGMDVAVISASEPISFVMGTGARSIGVKRLPKFTFHDTGLRTRTSECVLRVEKFREEKSMQAIRVDEAMGHAARLAIEGLIQYDSGDFAGGLRVLVESMRKGRECFYSWELVPGAAKRLEEDLLSQGALAVRMTGAGGGGMIVALRE